MDDRLPEHKMEQRDPALWGVVVLIVGITALFLWHWYAS
jgi:hypothetical protein